MIVRGRDAELAYAPHCSNSYGMEGPFHAFFYKRSALVGFCSVHRRD